mmetsp:Transcript_38250/g.151395  ORF Transcript_38250/g.151395 Transcript_38250/m.151395 type:complete len:161 (-) Transcript_38250:52-534(-)|eukprot:CAMPEP_0113953738 /NCGR_PEP_ID=MMETSP0011_2-20120614/10_1 /TAXON_ID=101924 /ORGANISM="Rhodosorus marinus" /LENGTH=160 /DNA_ID=CAMNT_0000962481 /DNA_START=178 /DNA_END=660 /DNA_ORIENTATION=+ /assembly_acc=CAM_ASM_000156
MVRSGGTRSNTRDMYSRPYRGHGMPSLSTYLTNFKVGDYVEIITNSAVQQGMPFKFYHGKTGRIFNISRGAVGVEVNKVVRNKKLAKRIHVRIEHVKKSRCTEELKTRVRSRDAMRREAREKGEKLVLPKRQPASMTKPAIVVAGDNIELLEPVKYEFIC